MKPRHIAMAAALALAAGLVVFGDTMPEDALAAAIEPAPALRAGAAAAAPAADQGPAILRLAPRETLIGDAGERFGQGGDALFARQDWTPPPPPPQPAAASVAPPPPSAPPLPFNYIGKSLQDGRWEIYLARGDRSYLVRADTVIDGTYRVDAIKPPVLTLTYLPLNQVQQLNIGVFD